MSAGEHSWQAFVLPLLFALAECHYFSFPYLCRGGSRSPLHHFCKEPGCLLGRVNTPAGRQLQSLGKITEDRVTGLREVQGAVGHQIEHEASLCCHIFLLFRLNDLTLEFWEIKRSDDVWSSGSI